MTSANTSATIIDSVVFRNIFSTEAMRRIFSDENRVQKYLDFEAALARAQARLGIIPQEAADEIVHHCNAGEMDFGKLEDANRAHRLSGAAGGAAARRALPRRARRMVPLGRDHAGRHRHAPPCCRSARRSRLSRPISTPSPTRWPASRANTATRRWPAAAICSRRCRSPSATRWRPCSPHSNGTSSASQELRARVLVGEFGGAAGTLASLGGRGLQVQAELMKELQLGVPADRLAHGARHASPRSAASSASSPAPAARSPSTSSS